MIMAYNPYNAINAIYNYKKNWATADKAGNEEAKKKESENAQVFYQQLRDNDYGKVADELSALDESGAKYIVDQYKPKSTIETNNLKSNEVNRENAGLFDKYNATYDELTKTNPFTTDEAKAILGKYSLAGLQARDNATASGGASNGGNIDSYASANAMRQQASLISQGQQTVLNSHQQKIDNIRGLLSDMGVNIDRVFNQDETSKNNDVARKSEIASVTGYVPDEWVASNNPYLNDNGTLKEEYKGDNIDFSKIMADAKAVGNTELYNAAAMARFYKIMGDYGTYGQYDDGNYIVPGQQETEARRQFNMQDATTRESLKTEKEIADEANKNALDQINAKTQGEKEILQETAALESAGNGVITEEVKSTTTSDLNKIFKGLKAQKVDKNGNPVSNETIDLTNVAGSVGGNYTLKKDTGGVVARYLYDVRKMDVDSIVSVMSIYGYTEENVKDYLSKVKDDYSGNKWVIVE